MGKISSEKSELLDEKLRLEENIEKKEHWNNQYKEDINKMKDDLYGKNQAIDALSKTLLDKGDEN